MTPTANLRLLYAVVGASLVLGGCPYLTAVGLACDESHACPNPLVCAGGHCEQPSDTSAEVGSDGGHESDGGLFLARVGSGTLTASSGDSLTLETVLVKSDGNPDAPAPVPNAQVTWKLLETPGQVTLSSTTATSDLAGRAQTTVTIGSGVTGEAKLLASSPGAATSAVWAIELEPLIEKLLIIPDGLLVTTTGANATAAYVTGNIATDATLLVQAIDSSGRPLAGINVTFSFVTAITGASFMDDSVVTTGAAGTAAAILVLGSVSGMYKVLASIPGNVYVTFNVTVANGTASCQLSSQCESGDVCVGGDCVDEGCSENGEICPVGYSCDSTSNTCMALSVSTCNSSTCPTGYSCDSSDNMCVPDDAQCSSTTSCPDGSNCESGICYPNGGETNIDVTGHWYTEYDFDVLAALPSWSQTSASTMQALDQILLGQIPELPADVQAVIGGVVQAYIPSWASTVVYLLNNLPMIFQELRVKGEMDLTAVGSIDVLYGTETWESLVFYVLSQRGANVGSPNPPPACAEVDVYTGALAEADFHTTVNPFSATVAGNQLLLNRRTAELELSGVIEYAINQIVLSTTGYASLQGPPGDPQEGALYNLIDCAGLAQFVMSAGIPTDITSTCQAFVSQVADGITSQLSNVSTPMNDLSFTAQASALCTSALDTPCDPRSSTATTALGLGYPDFETQAPADGSTNATFTGSANTVAGRWRAARQPF